MYLNWIGTLNAVHHFAVMNDHEDGCGLMQNLTVIISNWQQGVMLSFHLSGEYLLLVALTTDFRVAGLKKKIK